MLRDTRHSLNKAKEGDNPSIMGDFNSKEVCWEDVVKAYNNLKKNKNNDRLKHHMDEIFKGNLMKSSTSCTPPLSNGQM